MKIQFFLIFCLIVNLEISAFDRKDSDKSTFKIEKVYQRQVRQIKGTTIIEKPSITVTEESTERQQRRSRELERVQFKYDGGLGGRRQRNRPNPPGYNRRRNRQGNRGRFRRIRIRDRLERLRQQILNRRQQYNIHDLPALFV